MRSFALLLVLTAALSTLGCGRKTPTGPEPPTTQPTFQYVQSLNDPLLATVPMDEGRRAEIFGKRDANGTPVRIDAFHVVPPGESTGTYIQLDDQGRIELCLLPDGSWLQARYASETGSQIHFMAMYDAATGETVSHVDDSVVLPATAVPSVALESPAAGTAATSLPPRTVRLVCPSGSPVDMDVKMPRGRFRDLNGNRRWFRFTKGAEPGLFHYALPGRYAELDGGNVDCDWFAQRFRGIRASDFAGFLIQLLCRYTPPGGPNLVCGRFAGSVADLGRLEAYNFCQEVVTLVAEGEEAVGGTIELGLRIGAETFTGSFAVDFAQPNQHDDLPIDASSRVLLKPHVIRIGDPKRSYISAIVKNYCMSQEPTVCLEATPVSATGSSLSQCVAPNHWWTENRVGPINECAQYRVTLSRAGLDRPLAERDLGPVLACAHEATMDPENAKGGGYDLGGKMWFTGTSGGALTTTLQHEDRDRNNLPGWQRVWVSASSALTLGSAPQAGCQDGGGTFFQIEALGFQDVKAWDPGRGDYVHPYVRGMVMFRVVDRPSGDLVQCWFTPDRSDPNRALAVSGKLCEFTVTSGDVTVLLANQTCN